MNFRSASLYGMYFCLKFLVRSDVCFCDIMQVMCPFLCGLEISTADWQGPLLAFHELDQAFENDKCRYSDTDFQCDGTFPLVSSKLSWTRGRKHTNKANRIEDPLVTKSRERKFARFLKENELLRHPLSISSKVALLITYEFKLCRKKNYRQIEIDLQESRQ